MIGAEPSANSNGSGGHIHRQVGVRTLCNSKADLDLGAVTRTVMNPMVHLQVFGPIGLIELSLPFPENAFYVSPHNLCIWSNSHQSQYPNVCCISWSWLGRSSTP